MADPLVDPDEFEVYLNVTSIDTVRATAILALAQSLCESIVSPLPDGAEAVIMDVATRVWTNPTNAQSEGAGPFSASYGAVGGGLWLTRQNKATLRRLAGQGGAFSIDVLPATAGTSLSWWDSGSGPATEWGGAPSDWV